MQDLEDLVKGFQSISLEEMNSVKLMNRIDTKFLATREQLPAILAQLENCYFVQELQGSRVARYLTQYFDTPDLQMFVAHQDGKLTRQKLRTRIYCLTNDAFCEIKNKNNKKRTKKKRIPIHPEQCLHILDFEEIREFVSAKLHYDISTLLPQVHNEFERITLVNFGKTERLTIDANIQFTNPYTHQDAPLPELVIIELKQDGNHPSFFKKVLANMRIRPYRISKYCLGTMLTNPNVRINRFKKKLRYIGRLTHRKLIS